MLENVEWGEYRLGDLFEIEGTLSFNKDKLVDGSEYDYITRTSQNQGILQETGFVNAENINPAGVWSLGLLQMDFFYRRKPWYAGQFVRKITPKFELNDSTILYFTTILNKQKNNLLSVLVRDVDNLFLNTVINVPIVEHGGIDYKFIDCFIAELEAQRIAELEAQRIAELEAYLSVTGLKDYTLTEEEQQALDEYENIEWYKYSFMDIFDKIKQGRRLKKEDQKKGDIPFVMAGITNTGVVNYVSNPVATFPKNSITIDIFGNVFYRDYSFGAGDDTGVYWNDYKKYTKSTMLFFATMMDLSLKGKYSYGKKLRSSQSKGLKMLLPVKDCVIDFKFIDNFISAIQKLVIKQVVQYADSKIAATKEVVGR